MDNYSPIRIEMLGGFTIIEEGRRISEGNRKPSKVWRLIRYLVANKERPVAQNELLEVFCKDENKGNSGSILRTMVYRARATLAEEGLICAPDIITAKSGCYYWNNNIKCTTDVEDFEELIKAANGLGDTEEVEKLSLLLRALQLYKGDFLQDLSGEMWALTISRGYRNLYVNAVHETLGLLMKHNRITEAEELAAKALRIDPFDEYFILGYLKTLLAQNKNNEALEIYKKMETMFFDELGVNFSDELRDLYNEIQHTAEKGDTPLTEVVMRWLSDVDNTKVYYCDPSDFKILCQVEARSAHRSGHTTYVIRFNTRHDPNSKDVARGAGVMKNLEQAITDCLRASDIYTRYAPNQYLIMLRSLTYEDCKMLVSKIMRRVDAKYLPKIIDTSIMHVTAQGEYVNVDMNGAGLPAAAGEK